MKILSVRSGMVFATLLLALSGCTAKCSCPPTEPAAHTTIIHERPSSDY